MYTSPCQTDLQVDPSFQLALTCDSVWPFFKNDILPKRTIGTEWNTVWRISMLILTIITGSERDVANFPIACVGVCQNLDVVS